MEDPSDSLDGDELEEENAIPGPVGDGWTFTAIPEAYNLRVEQRDLLKLSNDFPVDCWKNFGRYLNVTENDIKGIESADSNVGEHRYQLLYKWYQGCEIPPNFGILIEAAKFTKSHRFAENIQKFALEKINDTVSDVEKTDNFQMQWLVHQYPRSSLSEPESKEGSLFSTLPQRGTSDSPVKNARPRKRRWSKLSDSSNPPMHYGSLDSALASEDGRVSQVLSQHSEISTESVNESEHTSADRESEYQSERKPTESVHQDQVSAPAAVNQQVQGTTSSIGYQQQHADQHVVHQKNFCQQTGTPQQYGEIMKGVTRKENYHDQETGEGDSPDPSKDKTELILGVLNFTPFRIIDKMKSRWPKFFDVIVILIGVSVIVQFFATIVVSYIPYSSQQNNPALAFFLPCITRLLPRFILPAVIVGHVVNIVYRRIYKPDPKPRFRKEIEQSRNEDIVKVVTDFYFTNQDVSHKSSEQILTEIRDRLCTDLNVMLVTSIVKGFIFPGCLYLAGAFHYPEVFYSDPKNHSFAKVAGVLDSVSLIILICANGIGFAFFFHEISIRHLIACVLKIPEFKELELRDKLHSATKNTLDCLLNDWTYMEMLLSYSIVGYWSIAVSLASAGIGLSYGIQIEQTHNIDKYWLIFIMVFLICHFLSTSVYCVYYSCTTGAILEILLFFTMLLLKDSVEFGPFLQILHILYPGAYLFWYVVSMMYHERMILDEKIKASIGKAKHKRRLIRNVGLCCLLCLSMFLAIYNEYHHLGSPKTAKAA